jgi:DNA-binding MarR family transcriptional regulator
MVQGYNRVQHHNRQLNLSIRFLHNLIDKFFVTEKEVNMKVEDTNYLTIQGWMRTKLNLTGNDLLVYAIIYGATQDGESKFTGSLQYLADWCGATKQGIQKNLKNLLDKGLIKKESRDFNGMTLVAYYTTELHTLQLSCINNISSISNTNILNNSNNINNTNKQNKLIEDNEDANYNIREKSKKINWFVVEYNNICKSLPKCVKLTDRRRKAILKLCNLYSEEEILQVFTNLENSDFCKGKNDRGWKADFDFILREDKFVAALEGKYNSKSRGCNAEAISHKGEPRRRVSQEEKEEMRRLVELGELEEY